MLHSVLSFVAFKFHLLTGPIILLQSNVVGIMRAIRLWSIPRHLWQGKGREWYRSDSGGMWRKRYVRCAATPPARRQKPWYNTL